MSRRVARGGKAVRGAPLGEAITTDCGFLPLFQQELAAHVGVPVAAPSLMPEAGAIVLECTNMPPCAAASRDAVQGPAYDICSTATWFHAGLGPRAWA